MHLRCYYLPSQAMPGMKPPKLPIDPQHVAAMQACVTHARALLDSAKAVQTTGNANVAYHLATLSLEEIGRRALMGVQHLADQQVVPPAWPKNHQHDHIKKLFWAFFGPEFYGNRLTAKGLTEMAGLAERIHGNRLAGLYVDNGEDGLSIPADAVLLEQAEELIGLAEARLGMAEAETVREDFTKADVELQAWFMTAVDDPEQRKQILSKGSMEKLAFSLIVVSTFTNWPRTPILRRPPISCGMAACLISSPCANSRPNLPWRVRSTSGSLT